MRLETLAIHAGSRVDPATGAAARRTHGFGSLVSFRVRGSQEATPGVAAWVRLFIRAAGFGGPESLIEQQASIEGSGTATPDDLIEDLDQVLRAADSGEGG